MVKKPYHRSDYIQVVSEWMNQKFLLKGFILLFQLQFLVHLLHAATFIYILF
jgi:hypothetical protein